MAFADSIAGRLGSTVWGANPMLGLGLTFGAGAGAYAGVHTYLNTEGTVGEKAAAARDSAGRYALLGGLGMGGALTVATWLPGEATGRAAGRFARQVPKSTARHMKSLQADFLIGKARGGVMGGLSSVAERKGLMLGLGAAVGAALGSHLDKDDPEAGSRKGAIVGGGAGLAISTGLRASRVWKGIPAAGKFGLISALSITAFGVASAVGQPRYASVDQAQREDSGLRDRMDSMGADGDLVFGLHNSR